MRGKLPGACGHTKWFRMIDDGLHLETCLTMEPCKHAHRGRAAFFRHAPPAPAGRPEGKGGAATKMGSHLRAHCLPRLRLGRGRRPVKIARSRSRGQDHGLADVEVLVLDDLPGAAGDRHLLGREDARQLAQDACGRGVGWKGGGGG
jgi:hypothetical protein